MISISRHCGVEDLWRTGERWIGPDVVNIVALDVLVEKPHTSTDYQFVGARVRLPGESCPRLKIGPMVLHKSSWHLLAGNPDPVQVRVGCVVEGREVTAGVKDGGRQIRVEERGHKDRANVVPL